MTQNELKLVFDALKECTTYAVAGGFGKRATAHRDALATLEKALAQPEPVEILFGSLPVYDTASPQRTWVGLDYEPVCPECKAGVLYECVACSSNNYPPQRTEPVFCEYCGGNDETPPDWIVLDHSALYTWVGLTDEEIDSYFEDHGWSSSKYYYPVIKDIEAKLKELNT